MTNGVSPAVNARIVLPGHADTAARVRVDAVAPGTRWARTLVLAGVWGSIATATFFVTVFDPFMTSMPVLVGAVTVYRSWRGRWLLRAFQAPCPRCGADLRVTPNARVATEHALVCYECHHEPRLILRAA